MIGLTSAVSSPPLDEFTTAILTLLRGDAVERGARWVYDGAYDGDPLRPAYPYAVLYRIPGGSSDVTPDMADSPHTVTAVWQVTTVGRFRNQVERAAQAAHDRLVGRARAPGLNQPWAYAHPLAMPPGWVCTERRPDPSMPGIDRSGEHPNAVFSLPARFHLTIAPA